MKYCCGGFERAYLNQKGRGFSVFSFEDYSSKPMFFLFFRAATLGSEKDAFISLSSENPSISLSLASETVINYCPWCGKKLARFYFKSWKEITGIPLSESTP